MVKDRKSTRLRDWYRVSVDTLRGCAAIVLLAMVAAAGLGGYKLARPWLDAREAGQAIAEAERLLDRLAGGDLGTYEGQRRQALESLGEARTQLALKSYAMARRSAETSRALLLSILDGQLHQRPHGEAQFISVEGRVEFRRGERGAWEAASGRDVLRPGDYVKTDGGGLAEIMFGDGTLYTARPNTLFVLGRQGPQAGGDERAIAMEYGWVDLSTSAHPSRVSTPGADATVEGQSEGLVAYDQGRQVGRFVTFRGGMEVTSAEGGRQSVGALQEVVVERTRVSLPRRLPPPPTLVEPPDNLEVTLVDGAQLVLRWQPVDGVERYALQVARDRLFVDTVIDVDDRAGTRATLGVRGEGIFAWRVAARGSEGGWGPWSEVQRFRVARPAPAAVPSADAAQSAAVGQGR